MMMGSWAISWDIRQQALRRKARRFTPTHSMPARGDREIIGRPARARQRKVPPLLRIVHKALPAHGGHQQVTPAPLRRRDGYRRRVRLDVETIIAGAHIDTA